MPIKQLQLRGISRTPSDRGTVDGACAESLNVHLDQTETAPTLPPDDISDDIYGEAATRFPIVFIHKMLAYKNYIGYNATTRRFKSYGSSGEDDMQEATLGAGETLNTVSSIGNTLIVFSDKTPYYFLFKEGSYIFLGNQIPIPCIDFITEKYLFGTTLGPEPLIDYMGGALDENQLIGSLNNNGTVSDWNAAITEGSEHHDDFLATWKNVWDGITLRMAEARKDGWFCAPMFVRYALKLYDGTYIHVSSPVYCGGGVSSHHDMAQSPWLYTELTQLTDPTPPEFHTYWTIQYFIPNAFKLRLLMKEYQLANWSDIITSVDVFISEPIYTPKLNADAESLTDNKDFVFDGMTGDLNDVMKEEMLKASIFYKVKSYELSSEEDMNELYSREASIENEDDIFGENLKVKEELKEGYRTSEQYIPYRESLNFNSRLLHVGASEVLARGPVQLNGLVADKEAQASVTPTGGLWTYLFRYKCVNSLTGDVVSFKGHNGMNDGDTFYPGYLSHTAPDDKKKQYFGLDEDPQAEEYFHTLPFSWLSYPDIRCKQVEVHYYKDGVWQGGKVIPMEEHPNLECSFAFLGYGVTLLDVLDDVNYEDAPQIGTAAPESRTFFASNKLLLSEFENPFLFPAANIITFPDEVVGVGLTSAPLSEGQVGDFDVYVFTAGGIRVLKTNSQGTFSINTTYPTNLSRHIALHGTITSMEQSIVFVTDRGVMLLVGGTVTELSASMNGKPYILDEDLVTLLADTEWGELAEASANGETLMGFMRTAKIAYDNNGSRLIFFNPDKGYQYVYMLKTETWHKILTGVTDPTILNSYPDCLVTNGNAVKNFSTVLDDIELLDDRANSVKGLIVTRPFDLGEPDIRKSINSIRVRGRYNRDNVRYVLMGSFDGINWYRLRSLHGGSYKMFRLALLCDLAPTERVTWIDIDYDSRFANKLR